MVSEWKQDRIDNLQNIKRIAHTIIEYIARFENELHAIWNKPKFVRKSNYVFTLDRIKKNIGLIEKLINDKGFERQVEEYKWLMSEWIDGNGKIEKIEWKEFKKAAEVNKKDVIVSIDGKKHLNTEYYNLPIDTRFFKDVEIDVLNNFENLDTEIDGYLIKSDNYQALNTLKNKYKNSIDLVYIDPPFNTGDDFLYKDKYQDSTWLTLMSNRITLTQDFLSKNGSFYIHLDENANYLGRMLV
ncbi:DNA methyltransferase [Candidatus Neomarinimicrobiota bacterium]